MAKAALEPQGRYDDLRRELIALYAAANEAADGSFRAAGRVPADARAQARVSIGRWRRLTPSSSTSTA